MLHSLTFVTGNANKLREAEQILGIELKQEEVANLHEVQTTSVREAVVHKARSAYEALGKPIMVEDSGLVFSAWNGLPGALVKWFEESVQNEGLLKMLESYDNRQAVAQCLVAVHDGKEIIVGCGEVTGSIAEEPAGSNGFGWDKIFIPDGFKVRYAEMSEEEKNAISHRRRAYEDIRSKLSV